jgi:hypothetical protein
MSLGLQLESQVEDGNSTFSPSPMLTIVAMKHFSVILTARIAKANPGFGIVGPFEPKATESKRGSKLFKD